jgi:L-fuconolactonase
VVIDAHVHVWDASRATYPWLSEVPSLARRYCLTDVLPSFDAAGVTGCVLVQAADDEADTELMLATAATHPTRVLGVVGWVPLTDPDRAEALLDRWAGHPLVGVRHLIHRDPDPQLLLRPEVDDTFALLADRGLAFDACAESLPLLELVPVLAQRHPRLTVVVDHLAKPPIRDRGWQPWAGLLAEAASLPNVAAKLSGLNTAASATWSSADFSPYVDHAVEVFGPTRLLYGGDWPFALLAADDYTQIWNGIHDCLGDLSDSERAGVLHDNAVATYGLERDRTTLR